MRTIALHDLVVVVEDRLPGTPSAALLGRFPAAPSGAPPALRLRLRPCAEARRPPADSAPSFFHGAVRAATSGGAFHLSDGDSLLTVSEGGDAIEGEVHARSLADPLAFAHATLTLALLLALRHHGLFHLHAAALVSPGGATFLVAGDAGAGKSTVALALAAFGFRFLGDDAVLLGRRAGAVRLQALPRAFHVGPATAAALPTLSPHLGVHYGSTGKRFLDADAAFPGAAAMSSGLPEVLLLPEIGEEAETALERTTPADALGALLECSALLAADGAARPAEHLALLSAVADGARPWRVRLGRDLLAEPTAWARRIADMTGA